MHKRTSITAAVGFVLVASLGSVHAAEVPPPPPCQYVQVLDPCQNDLLIFKTGEEFITHNVDLDLGQAGEFEATGVDFTTVPGKQDRFSFIAQGPFLRVIDHTLAGPWRSMYFDQGNAIPGLWFVRVDAAEPVVVGGNTVYPLYLSGYRITDSGAAEPYYLILDQKVILNGDPADDVPNADYSAATLSHGQLCVNGEHCAGTAVDIAASGPLASGPVQEAFASVRYMDTDSNAYHRYYRLTLASTGAVTLTLEHDEGVVFSGAAHRSLGLDYDSTGMFPTGVYQTTDVTLDLLTGVQSCPWFGDLTDVAVWGPDPDLNSEYFHFITTITPGNDFVIGMGAYECPVGGEGQLWTTTGDYPRRVSLSSKTSRDFWIYTANKEHGLTMQHATLESYLGQDRFTVIETVDDAFEGCPIDIVFRDEAITTCNVFGDQPNPGEPRQGPRDDECDPDDPDCNDGEQTPAEPPGDCDPALETCGLELGGRR